MATDTVNKNEWGCETDDLYLIHAVFRNAFGKAGELIRKADPSDSSRVLFVAGHLREAFEALHNHHHHEDDLYWDLIKRRAPEASGDVDRMVRHHEEIAVKIDETRGILEAWQKNPAEKEALLQALEQFRVMLFNHLEDEETTVKPVAGRVLTQAEWNKARTAGKNELKLSRVPYQIGYMLRCAPTEALRQEFWKELPGPIKLFYQHFGRKKFEREWEALYGKK